MSQTLRVEICSLEICISRPPRIPCRLNSGPHCSRNWSCCLRALESTCQNQNAPDLPSQPPINSVSMTWLSVWCRRKHAEHSSFCGISLKSTVHKSILVSHGPRNLFSFLLIILIGMKSFFCYLKRTPTSSVFT